MDPNSSGAAAAAAADSDMKSVTVWMCVHVSLLLLGER